MSESVRKTIWDAGLVTSTVSGKTVPRSFILRVTSGSSKGKQVAIGARAVAVGADPSCDLTLEDPKVSRRHLELRPHPYGIQIIDLGSTNGTYLDGVRVSDAVLSGTASMKIGSSGLRLSPAPLRTVPPSRRARFGGLVGESLAMREVFAVLELAAPTDVTVLIQGESGTGKELAARGLHDHSLRASDPFVVVDCSSAKEELIESQLFGHRRGAFTGAVADRKGAFVEAGEGTVFLDELGELPLSAQAKLLRVLEDRKVQPLGSDRWYPVNARVVAATHRDLAEMVEEKKFRFDLFHRLAVVHVAIPPLRRRLEDLPCLVQHFYEGRGVDAGPVEGENLEILNAHNWAGNVRELRNVLERAWVLTGSRSLRFGELQIWVDGGGGQPFSHDLVDTSLTFKEAKESCVAAFERKYLAAVFARNGRNIARAAAQAGINRRHFRKLLIEHGLREE